MNGLTTDPRFRLVPREIRTFGVARGNVLVNIGDCTGTTVAGAVFDAKMGDRRTLKLTYKN